MPIIDMRRSCEKKIILIISIFLLFSCNKNQKNSLSPIARENESIQEFVYSIKPETKKLSGYLLAKELRNLVYSETTITATNPEYYILSPLENIKRIVFDKSYGHYCGGISETYISLLRAFGFEARLIQMYSKTYNTQNNYGDTHVSSEVKINGKFIVMDATFNFDLKNPNSLELIGYNEAKIIHESNESLIIEGPDLTRLNNYYLPLSYFLTNFNEVFY